jgi:hypothetical protein
MRSGRAHAGGLISLRRADRTSFREAGDIGVVMHPVPAPTYNGYVDQRSIDVRAHTGIEAGLRGYPGDEAVI